MHDGSLVDATSNEIDQHGDESAVYRQFETVNEEQRNRHDTKHASRAKCLLSIADPSTRSVRAKLEEIGAFVRTGAYKGYRCFWRQWISITEERDQRRLSPHRVGFVAFSPVVVVVIVGELTASKRPRAVTGRSTR